MFCSLLKTLALVSDSNGKMIISYTTAAFYKELRIIEAFKMASIHELLIFKNHYNPLEKNKMPQG